MSHDHCGSGPATRVRLRRLAGVALLAGLAWSGWVSRAVADWRAPARDPQRFFRKYLWSYQEIQRRGVVMQQRDYSCGAAALATVIRYYWGDDVTEEQFLVLLEELLTTAELRERVQNGLALTDLRRLANKAGYEASMGKLQFEELRAAKVPVVVGITVNGHEHFVVFRGMNGGWVYVADPLRGNVRMPEGEFRRSWQENAILAVAKPGAKIKDVNPMRPRSSEIYRGWLNDQEVRTGVLTIRPPAPLSLPQ